MFTELIREEKRQQILDYFDKDPSSFRITRILYAIALALIATMGAFIGVRAGESVFLFLLVPMFGLVGWKLAYYNLLTLKAKYDKTNAHLFSSFLTSFIALIPSTGNVYQTLIACLPYTKEPLREKLEALILDIEDGNSRDGYLRFADYVGSGEAYMIMDMIYQFSEFGTKKETLKELHEYVHDLQKNKIDELIETKMLSMDMLGFMPIFISMFMVFGFAAVLVVHYVLTDVVGALDF